MGPTHIRILEAYYDGKNLVIRKTKLYDMKKKTDENVELISRWFFAYAAGETTLPKALVSMKG